MYHHLRGTLIDLKPMLAVVESHGVGYELRVPLSTSEFLKGRKEAFLYTSLIVREDEWRLYGFASRAERELFQLVLSVSGVGPSIALAGLSALSVTAFARALTDGETEVLCRIKGVGRRLAERLVVELKDRAARLAASEGAAAPIGKATNVDEVASTDARFLDAVAVLVELGYQRKAATERVRAAYRNLVERRDPDTGESRELSVESLIREALRQ